MRRPFPLSELFPGARALAFLLSAAACCLSAGAAELVTVTLAGGASVTAPLLRENDSGVALDLGSQVLVLQRAMILHQESAEAAVTTVGAQHDVWQTGRLSPAPVADLVAKYGDGVVMVSTPRGLGSGFFISAKGHLVTNYHVVERETEIKVTMFLRSEQGYERKELQKVKILALHPLRDLALLQIDAGELGVAPTPLVISDDLAQSVGDMVFTIGNPLGLERSVTQGIVSSSTRAFGYQRFIQTDAAVNPGNSGGPLFNARGEIVGVVCSGYVTFNGLAFGVPASDLVDFLRNREAYLYDAAQPQNGYTYHQPPGTVAGDVKPEKP